LAGRKHSSCSSLFRFPGPLLLTPLLLEGQAATLGVSRKPHPGDSALTVEAYDQRIERVGGLASALEPFDDALCHHLETGLDPID
jgi:hypothetical protein